MVRALSRGTTIEVKPETYIFAVAKLVPASPGSDLPCHQMDVYGKVSSDAKTTPVLNNWTVTFDCLNQE